MILTLWLSCQFVFNQACAEILGQSPPIVGYLTKSAAYTVELPHMRSPHLHGAVLETPTGKAPKSKQYAVFGMWGDFSNLNPYEFAMTRAAVWIQRTRIPIDDLVYFEIVEQVPRWLDNRSMFDKQYPRKRLLEKANQVWDPYVWGGHVDEAALYRTPLAVIDLSKLPIENVTPTGATRSKHFILEHTKSMEVWEGKGAWDGKQECWKVDYGKRAQERFPTLFFQYYYPLFRGNDYFFLTHDGSLYVAPSPEEGEKRKMCCLWNNPRQPIRTALVDLVTEQTWLFARSRDGKPEVFFELASELKVRKVDREHILPPTGIAGRMRTVLEYAQVLPNRLKLLRQ